MNNQPSHIESSYIDQSALIDQVIEAKNLSFECRTILICFLKGGCCTDGVIQDGNVRIEVHSYIQEAIEAGFIREESLNGHIKYYVLETPVRANNE